MRHLCVCVLEDRFPGSAEFFDCKACAANVVNANDGQGGEAGESDSDAEGVAVTTDVDVATSTSKQAAWEAFKAYLQAWMDFTEMSFVNAVAYRGINEVVLGC